MPVKQTQFAYDEEESDRKKKTGKTWKEIMILGIEKAEEQQGFVYVGDKKSAPTAETTAPDVKVETDLKPAVPAGAFEIIISPEPGVERVFDVYEEEMWQTVNAFSDVHEEEIFRMRDTKDGEETVVAINNVRCFSYEDLPYKDDRKRLCAVVKARAIV